MLNKDYQSHGFLRFCNTLSENVAWYFNYALRSFSFIYKQGDWLLTVKVAGIRKGQIAFLRTGSIQDCIELFYAFCRSPRSSGCRWVMARW